jgi:hypothetical protein
MGHDDERTHLIWQTFLLIASYICMAIGFIGLSILAMKPQWMHTIMGLFSE